MALRVSLSGIVWPVIVLQLFMFGRAIHCKPCIQPPAGFATTSGVFIQGLSTAIPQQFMYTLLLHVCWKKVHINPVFLIMFTSIA